MRRLLLVALVTLGGCARLNVEVDVIEPRYASAAALDAGLRMEAADIAASPHGRSDLFLARAFGAYDRFKNACIDEILPLATAARDAAAENSPAKVGHQQTIDNLTAAKSNHETRDQSQASLYNLDAAVLTAIGDDPVGAATARSSLPLSTPLRGALLARRAGIAAIERELRESVRGQTDVGLTCRTAAASAAPEAAQRLVASQQAKGAEAEREIHQAASQATITGEGMLLNNSLEAFYITSAPDHAWARRYNRAFGSGVFGSTSVAIVMNQTADFSVKGFIFDGRSTAQMVAKVGVQALSLIAASAGAPINLRPTPSATGSPSQFDVTQQISANRATVERAEAEQQAYDTALLRIAESVMANWTGLTAATESPASRGIVSGTLSAYRSSWQAPRQ